MSAGAPPDLAEGLAAYIAAVRATRAAPGAPLQAVRLAADLGAAAFARPRPAGMTVATSFFTGDAGETPFRRYRPAGEGRQRAIVYFHGGGFTTGSIESHDAPAAALAEAADATVISVHYARLPEATPRAIVEQCHDALRQSAAAAETLGIDPGHIAIAGDSAGAFIAALVAMKAREAGPPIRCQILAYGSYDLDPARDSYRTARDPILAAPVVRAMIDTYRACDARDPAPLPAPLRCADLTGLPPAFVLGAEHDPLLDEGRAYARRLRAAGVETEWRIAPAMPHGFLRALRFSAAAREEMRRIGAFTRSRL